MASAGNNTFIKKIYPVTQGTSSNVICYNPVTGDINYKLDSGTVLPNGTNKGDYIFWNSAWVVGSGNITLGRSAGLTGQGTNSVAIGSNVGQTNQGIQSVAIGYFAGYTGQGTKSVAIGSSVGQTNQGTQSVAIGYFSGLSNQGLTAIAIGNSAGYTGQGTNSVVIGNSAGYQNQGTNSVAIGLSAGFQNQGTNSVAIGNNAGLTVQGTNSVAIGNSAGLSNQAANSIILNASGSTLNTSNTGTYISPLRNSTDVSTTISSSNVVLYNNTTGELFYSNIASTLPKTFVIDHPVDSSRYLVHACLEGPESGVYYRGKGTIITTSVDVKLPDYTIDFYNFTISITPIGKPRTFSVSEFENGKFEVFSTPGDFYWVVYATRSDIDVEPYKLDTIIKGNGPYRWI